ncbi:PhzF family phenazine biosynthesis protein [Pseudarthrobacter sp. NPDC058362]|uniref:PhzF family phenazine biosynthesis protein n=1 Tax=Pseudarthrobacter sp. NPDC058362 TaxID=3346458 RepID=UPI003666B79A
MPSYAEFPFSQVDVFAPGPLPGNPVAVVHGADALTTGQMQRFANWTNLSETTFLLEPNAPEADYRVRIFTPADELPFAGHPTLGTAHAWLTAGGQPRDKGHLVQECGVGLVRVRAGGQSGTAEYAFAAPPLRRSGPVEQATLEQAVASLGVDPVRVLGSNWVDNGPGWMGIRLDSAETVLGLRPDFAAMGSLNLGVIGAYGAGGPADYEVRAFVPSLAVPEDPVTGSANAGLAQWMRREGNAPENYTVQQGTVLGRGGRISITNEADTTWVGGACRTVVSGRVTI